LLNIGVLVSGRGSNLQSIIDKIESGYLNCKIKVVISDKNEAKALNRAERHGIKNIFINPEDYSAKKKYEEKLIEILEKNEVELVVMAGFMRILSSFFIKHYKNRIMNIHPSLLPAFPGLDAQKQALDYGVKLSGCTVHFASEKMDNGPIIIQRAVEVKEGDTEKRLAQRILKKEHEILPEAIKLYESDKLEVKDDKVYINK